jgi:NADH-quinone oxidoreductase subunit M
MTFLPILGMAVIALIPKERLRAIRVTATLFSGFVMLLSILAYAAFDPNAPGSGKPGEGALQLVEHFVWIESFRIEYFMGVDGISISMVLLTGIIGFVGAWSSWGIEKSVKGYFSMYLLLLTGMMGVFVSMDFFLFYIFWEVMLLPMYFLIGIWGGPRKEYAAIKFFLYTLAGSVLMLVAMIAMYYASTAKGAPFMLANGSKVEHTFNLVSLAYNNTWSTATVLGVAFGKLMWVFLFIGFAIKVPMFPFHTWLPDAHVEAPTPISVILAGVLLKMGTYGMFRFNFAIFPGETQYFATMMAVFGVINIVYGALVAMAQTDLKKLVAYSSVSHMGFCLLGMASLTATGAAGAMFQMFNHGTITAMLFLLVGVIYDRAHHRQVDGFGGLAKVMPVYTAFVGLAFMAGLGLPGLSGFISEALTFLGSFPTFKVMTIISVSGIIITAGYFLWAMQRMFLGPLNEKYKALPEITVWEAAPLVGLAAIVIVLGFYPSPVLDAIKGGVGDLVSFVNKASPVMHAAAGF